MVFGAGSAGPGWGNGKAAAVQYAREGARVVCVDQYRAAAEGTAHIITLEGGAALALKADVTRSDEVGRAVEETVRAFGAIDILHNNVGVADVGELEDITEARWHKVIDANLTGPYLTCRRVIPVMMRAGRGAIINISSVAGTSINQYPYFCTRHRRPRSTISPAPSQSATRRTASGPTSWRPGSSTLRWWSACSRDSTMIWPQCN